MRPFAKLLWTLIIITYYIIIIIIIIIIISHVALHQYNRA